MATITRITVITLTRITVMRSRNLDQRPRESYSRPSPAGRGRPRKARVGEAGQNQIDGSVPPHPNPLPIGERECAPPHRDAESHVDSAALYRLMAWLSPAYPVGAFSYSSGIEWAVEAGDIRNSQTLRKWLEVAISQGGGFADAVFFVHAHGAIAASDDAALHAVAELAAAFVPSKERFLETTAQGRAFLEATRAAWPCPALDRLNAVWNGPVALPVAVGVSCAGHRIGADPALRAFLHALAANWISAGVRLIPLGQTDGQRVLAALERSVASAAARALAMPLDEIGTCAFRADIAGMRHETQYTRLFRS
jgi:urease accessory protein